MYFLVYNFQLDKFTLIASRVLSRFVPLHEPDILCLLHKVKEIAQELVLLFAFVCWSTTLTGLLLVEAEELFYDNFIRQYCDRRIFFFLFLRLVVKFVKLTQMCFIKCIKASHYILDIFTRDLLKRIS